jgi:hypothetical protein
VIYLAALLAAGMLIAAPDEDVGAVPAHDPLHLGRVEAIVEQAHQFLLEHQDVDGSFSRVRNTAGYSAPVAVTALAALSFMAAGYAPDPERGSMGRALSRAIDWLIDRCGDDGYFYYERDEISRMHGQGYALVALTQAYGMYVTDPVQHRRLHDAIVRGVALIENSQGTLGGWYYEPRRMDAHEGSITVCMLQALRAARDAGFAVDGGVVSRAQVYMWRSQNPEGRFAYAINDTKTSWALTAAALSTLNALGDYGSDRLQLGFDALQRDDPFTGGGRFESFIDYGALYAAQAYWHYRDPAVFERWWTEYLDNCERRQRDDGSFFEGQYGSIYATSIVTLSLQVPLGYLPLFQK